ncbi:MAG: YaiI/YqxD family protein [Oscillospiraceae bacterium]|nr:YaiI/YqxD family protein [Oscillospiraceae bacterium]
MPQILVDADACPVVDETIAVAKQHGLPVTLITDTAHWIQREGAVTITVEKGSDSADFRLVNLVKQGDIVITQDYGLAAMVLSKGGHILNQNGSRYSDENIDGLLMSRHIGKKIRRAGGRIKGPSKRTKEQDQRFIWALEALIREVLALN